MSRAPYDLAAPQNKGFWAKPDNLRLLVVDASYLIHRSFHTPGVRELKSPDGLPTGTLMGFTRELVRATAKQSPTHLVCVFDSPTGANARRAIYPAYKSTRPPKPVDLRWGATWCRWIAERLGAVVLEDAALEADDLIASAVSQVRGRASPPTAVVLTGDKDLAQLVTRGVTVWDGKTDPKDARDIEADHGARPDQVADLLAIAGDASDNIPGVKGVGIKGAAQLLKAAGSLAALLEGHWSDCPTLPDRQTNKLTVKARAVRDQREAALLSAELVRLRVVPLPELTGRAYPKEAELAAMLKVLGCRQLLADLGLGAQPANPEIESELRGSLLASYAAIYPAPVEPTCPGPAELNEASPEPAAEPAPEEAQPCLLVADKPEASKLSMGGRLREARKAAGLSMGDAARRLGVTATSISDIERDQCPPDPSTIAALAQLYGADPEELAGELEVEPEEEHVDLGDDLVFGDAPNLNHVLTPMAAAQIVERLRQRLGADYQVDVECGVVISVRGGGYGLVTRCMSRPGDTPDAVAAELAKIATSRRVA